MAALLPFLNRVPGAASSSTSPRARWHAPSSAVSATFSSPPARAAWRASRSKCSAGGLAGCLEVWSNKNLDSQASHVERGSTPGWLITCRADVVGFHFLDADTALFLPLFRLQQWAFGTGDQGGRIYDFPERRQRRYVQRNDSWGRIVPVECSRGKWGSSARRSPADIAGAAMMRSTGWSQCYSAPADRRRYHKYQIQRPMTAHRSVAPAAPVARPRAAASGSSLSSGSMTNGMSQVSGYQVQRRQRQFRHLFDPRRPGEHVAAGGGRVCVPGGAPDSRTVS